MHAVNATETRSAPRASFAEGSGLRIVEGSLADKISALSALFDEHWQEVGSHKNVRTLSIDTGKYASLEAAGTLFALFVLDGDQVVGYSVNFITTGPHASGTIYAQNDALFVQPAYRKRMAGVRLMQATERAAKAHGAKLMVWHAKEGTGLGPLLQRLGYGVLDVLYSKEI